MKNIEKKQAVKTTSQNNVSNNTDTCNRENSQKEKNSSLRDSKDEQDAEQDERKQNGKTGKGKGDVPNPEDGNNNNYKDSSKHPDSILADKELYGDKDSKHKPTNQTNEPEWDGKDNAENFEGSLKPHGQKSVTDEYSTEEQDNETEERDEDEENAEQNDERGL